MKYCPNCGTPLNFGVASYCYECGRSIEEQARDGSPEPFIIQTEEKREEQRRQVDWNIPYKEKKKSTRSSYDGYYDDIEPEDGIVHENSKIDGAQIKKIGLVIAGVILITVVCICLLFIL